jgi:hypothetical protein
VHRQLSFASADPEGGEKEVDYSNIWTPQKFQDAEYWFLKTSKLDFDCCTVHFEDLLSTAHQQMH